MTQLENVTQELNLIQFGFMKLNNTLQILHTSKSDEDLIKQMQDDHIELFNEFTLKVQELRGDFLSNLEGIGMLLEEDYNYINSVNELINSPSQHFLQRLATLRSGRLDVQTFKQAQMLKNSNNLEVTTLPAITQNGCYVPFFFTNIN